MTLLALLLLAGEPVPLPVGRSAILRDEGATYFVEGVQRVPRGTELSIQKEVKIVGRGKEAVLEVEGELQVHGTRDREVIFEGVTLRPAPVFLELRLDSVIFRGSGGLRTPKGQASSGKISVEHATFTDAAGLDLTMSAGELLLIETHSFEPARVAGAAQSEKAGCALKLRIESCHNPQNNVNSGFVGGLLVEGVMGATVRLTRMAGARSEFRDCPALTFDGNKVNSAALAFLHSAPGGFKGTRFLKCDCYSDSVRFVAPEGGKERVTLDKWWFRGLVKPEEIQERVVKDGRDEPGNGALVDFAKINGRPLELAGPVDR